MGEITPHVKSKRNSRFQNETIRQPEHMEKGAEANFHQVKRQHLCS